MEKDIAICPTPEIVQRYGVGCEVPVCQHCPLATARGARGIDDRGEICGRSMNRLEAFRLFLYPLGQGPITFRSEREDMIDTEFSSESGDPIKVGGPANHGRWFRVTEKILHFRRPVGRVERDKNVSSPQRSEIEEQGVRRFLDLDDNPGGRWQFEGPQQIGKSAAGAVEIIPGVTATFGRLKEPCSPVGGVTFFDQGKEVLVGASLHLYAVGDAGNETVSAAYRSDAERFGGNSLSQRIRTRQRSP